MNPSVSQDTWFYIPDLFMISQNKLCQLPNIKMASKVVLAIAAAKVYSKLRKAVCTSATCLAGKTALIIGGNKGEGINTAKNLAARGCKVLIADRSLLENMSYTLKNDTSNKNIFCEYIDLASLSSVRSFAQKIKNTEKHLDILIIMPIVRRPINVYTDDGLLTVMQINYFAPLLATYLLIDLMKQSESRIIFTASKLSFFHNLSIRSPEINKLSLSKFNIRKNLIEVANSKICIMAAAEVLAEKLKGTKVTCNVVYPGFTNIFQAQTTGKGGVPILKPEEKFIILTILFGIIRYFVKDDWEKAQTILHCSVAQEVKGLSGMYFNNCKKTRVRPTYLMNSNFKKKIIDETEKLIKLQENEKL